MLFTLSKLPFKLFILKNCPSSFILAKLLMFLNLPILLYASLFDTIYLIRKKLKQMHKIGVKSRFSVRRGRIFLQQSNFLHELSAPSESGMSCSDPHNLHLHCELFWPPQMQSPAIPLLLCRECHAGEISRNLRSGCKVKMCTPCAVLATRSQFYCDFKPRTSADPQICKRECNN